MSVAAISHTSSGHLRKWQPDFAKHIQSCWCHNGYLTSNLGKHQYYFKGIQLGRFNEFVLNIMR
jgi:hypothetical protein